MLLMLFMFGSIVTAQHWVNYTKENSDIPDNEVRAICIDNKNIKWFGTRNGLSRFDDKTFTTYTTDNNLANNSVNSIAYEIIPQGTNIWVGTDNGVSVINVLPNSVSVAAPFRKDNSGLISNIVRAVAVDEYQFIWFGTDAGISNYDGNAWTSFTAELNNYLTSNDILSIFPVKEFAMYFGTLGGGVSRFDSITQATPYTTKIASDVVYSIYASKKGDEWFGTDAGLSHHTSEWPGIYWTNYTLEDGLADNTVRSVMAENDSVVWAGTDNGLSRFDGVKWMTYTTNDGLAGNKIYAIARDADGSFWFGTDSGVSHYTPAVTSVEKNDKQPFELRIDGIYPNPFNLKTSISFRIPSDGFVEFEIYNLAGQRVKRLVSSWMRSGSRQVVWDGCNSAGSCVSSGIYIARLSMGRYFSSAKLTIIK